MLRLSDDDAENARLWSSLPELADYQTLGQLKPAANSLLNVRIGDRQQPLGHAAVRPRPQLDPGDGRHVALADGPAGRGPAA